MDKRKKALVTELSNEVTKYILKNNTLRGVGLSDVDLFYNVITSSLTAVMFIAERTREEREACLSKMVDKIVADFAAFEKLERCE